MDLDVQLIHLRRTRESAASALIDSMTEIPEDGSRKPI